MKFLHKSASNLPIIIIIEWLICALFLTNNEYYRTHFEIFDKIDTYVVYLSLMHCMYFYKEYYSLTKKTFVFAILLGIFLRFIGDCLNEEVYYFIYYIIVLMPFIACVWRTSNKKKD